MGPRKKSKPNATSKDEPESSAPPSSTQTTDNNEVGTTVTSAETTSDSRTESISIPEHKDKAKPRGQGWYGSLRSKAGPSTQVHRESISSETPRNEITSPQRRNTIDKSKDVASSPHKYMSAQTLKNSRGVPLDSLTSTTNVSIVSGKSLENVTDTKMEPETAAEDPPLPPDPTPETTSTDKPTKDDKEETTEPQSTGWFAGWWSRPDGYKERDSATKNENLIIQEATSTPLPKSQADTLKNVAGHTEPEPSTSIQEPSTTEQSGLTETKQNQTNADTKSWFWRWSTAQNSQILAATGEDVSKPPDVPSEEPERPATPLQAPKKPTDDDSKSVRSINGTIKSVKEVTARKASGWAFWSQASINSVDDTSAEQDDVVQKQVGELAVANTESESRPEAAQFNSSTDQGEAQSEPLKENPPKKGSEAKDRKPKKSKSAKTASASAEAVKVTDATTALLKVGSHKKDILLPRFPSTYSMMQKPSLLQNVRQYFMGTPQQHPHLHLVENPRRIKNALAIGVHGFFPNALYQKLLGAPTGTSIKFANMAAAAIKSWTEAHGYECSIEKAALEGEGVIADRIETLWKLLLNWIDHIRAADFILIASHSQGVPISVMLVDRLIKFGCISSAKIGIVAMAGISLGPFIEYKTQIFGKSALELFDFANPNSSVSTAYRAALGEVLKHNVKIVFTGSLDDQLVSLESSTFSNISHPCIYRAAFIDGRYFSSDFITELVGFALKLRNLGLSDHGLIRELSPALAGSLYSGEGHSRLYDSPDVYALAVAHALETTSPAENTAMVVQKYDGPPGKDSNPYFLPWAMRGILEEEKVRKELAEELSNLLSLFEQWKPSTKQLKDIRYKLEALKSKL